MRTADTTLRGALVVVAVAAVLAGAPTAVTVVLVAAATATVTTTLVRRRERGGVDAALVGVGGVLVLLVVLGVALDRTGLRLERSTWALAVGVVSLLALAVHARRERELGAPEPSRRPRVRDLAWFAAAAAVVAVAIGISVRSVEQVDVAPVAMSVGPVQGTSVEVLISADEGAGPFELRTDSGDGNTISYPLVTLRAGEDLRTTVSLPREGRYVISLNNPGEDAPVRTLTVDR